jgi:hypothetical protein
VFSFFKIENARFIFSFFLSTFSFLNKILQSIAFLFGEMISKK